MAEAVIIGIAGEITVNLVPQALKKVGKLWGIKHDLEVLGDIVSTIRAILNDAEEQYYHSHQIQVWLEKLKDTLYDAQDVLEEFNMEAMRRELRGFNEMIKEIRTFFSNSNQLAFKLKMSSKVKEVRERIEAINASRRIHLEERPVDLRVKREWRKREETHSFVCKGDIRGRDDDKKTIMEFLSDSNVNENVSILPIVGIGGLGKTALAQFVFNDETVSKQFNLKMWVCVSNDFDMKKILKNIITCAKKKEPTEAMMEQLQSELREEIDGKRYFLVLDDLWNVERETWQSLQTLLLGGARGSKILITTRLPLVANITSTAPPHLLCGLSESASLDLLMHMACQKKEAMQDPDMLAIGNEIVRKCSGVPLVVRTVGSLLFFKKTKLEWLHFKDDELPQVSQSEDNINKVLRLSYDHLPSHLKQCFGFCSLFPKDYEIKKQTLVDLWMAEGFIKQSNKSQHLEDIACGYFKDLLWRNFFQDYQEDKETCKMHDLMHDLVCLVAGIETRHVSCDSTSSNLMDKLITSCLKAIALRTILSTIDPSDMLWTSEQICLHRLIQSFKRLRILDMHATYVEKVPRSICMLKHLTYLDLSYNNALKRLPNSITRLQNLQTLNLSWCDNLEELPRGIRKLVNLRNLDIDHCSKLSYLPRGLGELSFLHRLTRFILPKDKTRVKNYCRLAELNGLNNIRGSLHIENLGSVTDAVAESKAMNLIGNPDDAIIGNRDEALLNGLRPHSNLQKLTIWGYKGERFPKWMIDSLVSSLSNLVEVCFYNCRRCKHLPPLGQLPHLKALEIWELTELEYIKLDHSSNFTISFPNLLTLSINRSEKLKAMPRAPYLEDLDLIKVDPALINHMLGLNKLKRLRIESMESLERLPGVFEKSYIT
ncbi:hypothetical protein BT93_B0805 [Corymbia citriodora subsp. variegata]|nr:hypothetical protein BT93_B0805 [Corymbia citriodora subsp. variegata]